MSAFSSYLVKERLRVIACRTISGTGVCFLSQDAQSQWLNPLVAHVKMAKKKSDTSAWISLFWHRPVGFPQHLILTGLRSQQGCVNRSPASSSSPQNRRTHPPTPILASSCIVALHQFRFVVPDPKTHTGTVRHAAVQPGLAAGCECVAQTDVGVSYRLAQPSCLSGRL